MSQLPYFYDEELNKISCHTYHDFLSTLNIISSKEINVNRSGFTTPYNIFFKDGSNKDYVAWYNLFSALKDDFDVDIDLTKSFKNLSAHYLYLNFTPTFNSVKSSENKESLIVDSIVKEDEDSIEVIKNVPDYDYLMSFYDDSKKAKSKDELERYCIKHYNINLRKNQSFDKMIEELRGYFE
jgi:hypothetical protein